MATVRLLRICLLFRTGTWEFRLKIGYNTFSKRHRFYPLWKRFKGLFTAKVKQYRLRQMQTYAHSLKKWIAHPLSSLIASAFPSTLGRCEKIGPWDLCWFKRWRIYLLCFYAIGCKFVDISFAGVFDIFWTFLTHQSRSLANYLKFHQEQIGNWHFCSIINPCRSFWYFLDFCHPF